MRRCMAVVLPFGAEEGKVEVGCGHGGGSRWPLSWSRTMSWLHCQFGEEAEMASNGMA